MSRLQFNDVSGLSYSGIKIDRMTGEPYASFTGIESFPAGDRLIEVRADQGQLERTIEKLSRDRDSMAESESPEILERAERFSQKIQQYNEIHRELTDSVELIDQFRNSDAFQSGRVQMNDTGFQAFTSRITNSVGGFMDSIRQKAAGIFGGPSSDFGKGL